MRLLVITQKVDKNDPVLGFFHNWLAKLSTKFESIIVICLGKGEHDLPANVKVLSLGKTKNYKPNLLRLIAVFYKYILGNRDKYDTVFVHMNQEYVLLSGPFWKILRKKIYFWRNHPSGSVLTRIAVMLSNKVFYTSPFSFTARFKKSVEMPVGIDTELFQPSSKFRVPGSILSLGRISPIKNVDLIINAARALQKKNIQFTLDIVGDPVNPEDVGYKKKLIDDNKDLIGEGVVNFSPAVPNYKTPELYSAHEIYINLTPTGSMDKTILEAVSCGCIPIVMNESFIGSFDEKMIVKDNLDDIVAKIEHWLAAPEALKNDWSNKLQKYVADQHSLNGLVSKMVIEIKNGR